MGFKRYDIATRDVMIPGLELASETDFHLFHKIVILIPIPDEFVTSNFEFCN